MKTASIKALCFCAVCFFQILSNAAEPERHTEVSIKDDGFLINGKPTYAGRQWNGQKIEGLLLNSRMVQGIFDDLNPETRGKWNYPDTGKWDAERNTREFLAAMPEWKRHGLLCFTICLQGGSPQGYSNDQPWHNSAITEDGGLRADYMARLEKILDKADELGMVVILGIFYFGQDQRVKDEAAIVKAFDASLDWIFDRGYKHVMIEVANECDNAKYDHAILKSARIGELVERCKKHERNGRRLLVSASFNGGRIPNETIAASADFLLVHGNGVADPAKITELVKKTRAVKGYHSQPILFNEDDHFDFEKPSNNFAEAVKSYASWGYFDPGKSDYIEGYQCPPVNWGINTERKKAFFAKVKEITGY